MFTGYLVIGMTIKIKTPIMYLVYTLSETRLVSFHELSHLILTSAIYSLLFLLVL